MGLVQEWVPKSLGIPVTTKYRLKEEQLERRPENFRRG